MMSERRIVQSVERAINILEMFSEGKSELSVKEISERLDLSKSTVHGLISTLYVHKFLRQDPESSKYSLGLKLLKLGNLVKLNNAVIRISRPYLEDLVHKYEETVHLAIEDNMEVVYIDKIKGNREMVINSQIGKRNPMYCTGVGKCLLAFLEEDKIKRVLDNKMERFTENTIIEKDEIESELEKIRTQEYAVDNEEFEIGLSCFAAPVKDYSGRVLAAISLSGASSRVSEKKSSRIINSIKEAAEAVSKELGYKGYN